MRLGNLDFHLISTSRSRAATAGELRRFGLVMSFALILFSALWRWRSDHTPLLLIAIAGIFVMMAWLAPEQLRVVQKTWLTIGEKLGGVVSLLILTMTFFLVLTPLAFLRRLFGSDSLGLNFENQKSSYWIPAEPQGPATRPDKPY